MEFEKEIDFEDALVKCLTEKCGWSGGVLNHPTEDDLLRNWAEILFRNNRSIDRLGDWPLTDGEMQQILEQIKTLRTPLKLNEFVNGKTVCVKRDNPDDKAHFGREVSLDVYDRMQIAGGKTCYQIARQPVLKTPHPLASDRRGDVMLLINGMPLIHVELKRSGVAVGQATNQIEKYMREGALGGLFSLIQVFVGMEPKETVYFANPGPDGRFNRDYFFHWTDFNNVRVNDWSEIAERLLSIPMAHQLIGYYSVADKSDGVLKVLRPYQFYAASAIFNKVRKNDEWEGGKARLGGYVWHTTGSGKTLTCFKSAELIASTKSADKVVFLLDRKELGTQSLRDYRGFAGIISVQATENTNTLVSKLRSDNNDDMLIVTSIQKMSRIRDEADNAFAADLERMREKRIVFIVDEAHRDVNGEMLLTIKNTFPEAMFFGFTGTPKLKDGRDPTTATVFGDELHRYTIADGINDHNVLGFDPCMVLTMQDADVRRTVALDRVHAKTEKEALDDPARCEIYLKWMNNKAEVPMERIEAELPTSQYNRPEHRAMVVQDIRKKWSVLSFGGKFHALLATASIPEAIEYYRLLHQEMSELKVTALFDPNIDNNGGTEIKEEALLEILTDYNRRYGTHFTVPLWDKFKKDVSSRLAHKDGYQGIEKHPEKEIDMLVVVDQMLTGFDSKWLNTLYLDKMREEENLIQAFSRTNRLFGAEKPFGLIRYYRKPHTMAKNIEDALKLYSGDRPFALYVEHLDGNLKGMNHTYEEIRHLFEENGIRDFERLPDDVAARAQFALLFKRFNDYLNAARIQGFTWEESVYSFEHEGQEETLVTMQIDKRVFGILALRYKELSKSGAGDGAGNGGSGDVPFDIDPHLTEIDTGLINAEYLNSKFQRYVRCLEQHNVTPEELASVREELHQSFASLSQEDQVFAQMFIDDLSSGNIQLEPGLSISDYIAQYRNKEMSHDIDQAVAAFGLDKHLLIELLRRGPLDAENIDAFGRYTNLVKSVDNARAKAYLERAMGEKLGEFAYHARLDMVLREFLYSGGKGEKIPKIVQPPTILNEISDALKFRGWLPVYGFAAACGKFGAGEEVACAGWMDVTGAGLGRLGRNENLFVVQAKGHSMEPKILDGQFCVFEHRKGEFHDNDIVLAQHAPYADAETGGAFSIKKIVASLAKGDAAHEHEYESFALKPVNPSCSAIQIPNEGEFGLDYKIVGVMIKAL